MHCQHLYGTGLGWVFPVVAFILIILVSVYIFQLIQEKRGKGGKEETALETLKKRYAKGEITKEEFDKIKNDLLKD